MVSYRRYSKYIYMKPADCTFAVVYIYLKKLED